MPAPPLIPQPTVKQLALLAQLASERAVALPQPVSRADASTEIARLLRLPKAHTPAPARQSDRQRALLRDLRQQLRRLALDRGETFAYPRTIAEARGELQRLRGRVRSTPVERRLDRDAVRFGDVAHQPASSVTVEEVDGYGASATWAAVA